MRIPLTILLLYLFTNAFPHQDTFYKYKYDNISVILQTGFYNEQVNNVKLIGQYASLLCKKNQYNGQVFLFFGHDYIPDNESANQTFMSIRNDFIYEILGFKAYVDRDSIHPIFLNNDEKIVIQQFDVNFSIRETMELLNFAINNAELLKNDTENCYTLGYDIITISRRIIDSTKILNSEIVNKVLKNKVIIFPKPEKESRMEFFFDVSYYSENGKYILIDNNETLIDTLNQISIIGSNNYWLNNYIVVLEADGNLTIYSCKPLINKGYEKSNYCLKDLVRPDNGISGIKITLVKSDVILIQLLEWSGAYTDMNYIYRRDNNVLITDLMEYINSYK